VRGKLQRGAIAQRIDVIDDRGTRADRGRHDGGLGRIDRDGHVQRCTDALDDGHDAGHFRVCVDRRGPRSRRFPADIDDQRALGDHRRSTIQRSVSLQVASAVGEGIRRDVQDAHHDGPAEVQGPVEAAPVHLKFKAGGIATGLKGLLRTRARR
jgi:hypothetical protein